MKLGRREKEGEKQKGREFLITEQALIYTYISFILILFCWLFSSSCEMLIRVFWDQYAVSEIQEKFSLGSRKICQDTLNEESKVEKTHTPVHFNNLTHNMQWERTLHYNRAFARCQVWYWVLHVSCLTESIQSVKSSQISSCFSEEETAPGYIISKQ